MLYWLWLTRAIPSVIMKFLREIEQILYLCLSIRNQCQSIQEEYPQSLPSDMADALTCASCIRVNDAFLCLHAKYLQKLDSSFLL